MKVKNLILWFYLVSSFVVAVTLKNTGNYGLAVSYRNVSDISKIPWNFFVSVILTYIIFVIAYKLVTSLKLLTSKVYQPSLAQLVLILSIIINISTLTQGIGRAGGGVSDLGFLQSILPLTPLTLVYFSVVRSNINKFSFLLIAFAILIGLLKGWSGHIASLAMLETLYRFNDRKLGFIFISKLAAVFLLVLGLFYYLVAIKFYIRSGGFELMFIGEYLLYVFGRVSHFAVYNYLTEVYHSLYLDLSLENGTFYYIYEFFISVVPKSIFGFSGYRFSDNIYSVNYVNSQLPNAGFSITLPGLFLLNSESTAGLLVLIFVLTLVILLLWLLIKILIPRVMQKNFLFVSLLSFLSSGSIKEVSILLYTLCVLLIMLLFLKMVIPIKE